MFFALVSASNTPRLAHVIGVREHIVDIKCFTVGLIIEEHPTATTENVHVVVCRSYLGEDKQSGEHIGEIHLCSELHHVLGACSCGGY